MLFRRKKENETEAFPLGEYTEQDVVSMALIMGALYQRITEGDTDDVDSLVVKAAGFLWLNGAADDYKASKVKDPGAAFCFGAAIGYTLASVGIEALSQLQAEATEAKEGPDVILH